MTAKQITILGVGNLLFSDEGFGIRVLQALADRYLFPPGVSLIDGGVLGLGLLGAISTSDQLIVVDAIRHQGAPGTLYRLAGDAIPKRIRAKNSLHQVDLLEALTLCQALDKVPEVVIVGVEPEDILTLGTSLTETVKRRLDDVLQMVLHELHRWGVTVCKKGVENKHVPCDSI